MRRLALKSCPSRLLLSPLLLWCSYRAGLNPNTVPDPAEGTCQLNRAGKRGCTCA
jgi:hypothetical protein